MLPEDLSHFWMPMIFGNRISSKKWSTLWNLKMQNWPTPLIPVATKIWILQSVISKLIRLSILIIFWKPADCLCFRQCTIPKESGNSIFLKAQNAKTTWCGWNFWRKSRKENHSKKPYQNTECCPTAFPETNQTLWKTNIWFTKIIWNFQLWNRSIILRIGRLMVLSNILKSSINGIFKRI